MYEQNIPTTQLVKRIADVMQEYTQSGYLSIFISSTCIRETSLNFFFIDSGVRPFGVSLLICGFDYDENRPFLYQCDPSV